MRRYAQRCWKARLKPKVDCKRNQIHVYNHAAVWTRLSGGHGGAGSFATKKRREHQQQQGNLADVLQNTLNQWMHSQRAPKRQKATAQDCCSDTSLLSILEATLADCKKHKRDDMAVANAVQEALTSHQQGCGKKHRLGHLKVPTGSAQGGLQEQRTFEILGKNFSQDLLRILHPSKPFFWNLMSGFPHLAST